ncbi:hypothetical protein LXL04_035343 [Taraxacum kok-saghyz]
MEEDEVVYRRCIGEGSGSKRSSGRGSNNLTSINFAPTLPYYGNLPGYPIIHENLAIEPATYHQAPLDNFKLGFDDTDTFLEPNNTNNNVENPEKIPFLNDNKIIPGRNAGNPEEDFFLGSDTEINDSEDQPLGDDYSEAPAHDPVYAPVSSVRLDYRETIKIHQLFQSKRELIDSLGVHAICEQKQFKTVKSTKSRFDAKCIDTNCSWHVHATRVENSDFFQLRTYNGKHTCSSTQLNPNHRQATKRVLAKFVAEVYSKSPNRAYTGKDIVADINLRYKIQITYHQAWRAKKFALELLRGTHEESFAKLPVYCHNLKIHNPGTVTYIQTDELERRVIVVDGAHLKGEYKGNMLVAVRTDGNNQILPIAFAICRSETNENWILFFQKLYESICYDPGWTNSEGPTSSPCDWLLKGEVSGSSLTNNLPPRYCPRRYGWGTLRCRAFGVGPTRVVTKKCTFLLRPGLDQLRRPGIVRSSSPIHPNHIALDNTAKADSNLRPHPLIASHKGCYHQLSCSSTGDSSPCDWLLKGEVSGSSLTNNLPPRYCPRRYGWGVRVSPTTCLRGIVQGDMVGTLRFRAFGVGPTRVVTKKCTFLLRPGLDQLRRPGIVRSSSPIHPNHIALDNTAKAGCWVRSQVRVSPTTCLRGIVQGDMVGVYWAARPYDSGPSELVQPGSFESHQQPAFAVLSKAIWLGCIGLLDLTIPGLRSWSNPGRNTIGEIHGLCVISDRNQGTANACALIFPNAKHGVCGKHVHGNVVQKRGESSKTAKIFFKATKAYTVHTFKMFYDLLRAHDFVAWKYVDDIGPEKWSRAIQVVDII